MGLDLGKQQDYTALTITERKIEDEKPEYYVRYICRYQLGTDYTRIIDDTRDTLQRPPVLDAGELIVDAGGPGWPVIDQLRRIGMRPITITITGGEAVSRTSWHEWHVPKQDLCTTVRLLMERGQLHVSGALPEAPLLRRELAGFQMKRTQAANLIFSAREGEHDDLVLSLAIALWWGERPKGVFFA